MEKACMECSKMKPLSEFYQNRGTTDTNCKECRKAKAYAYRNRVKPERIPESRRRAERAELKRKDMKRCTACDEVKRLSEFHGLNAKRENVQSQCKRCTALRQTADRHRNPEKANSRQRKYYRTPSGYASKLCGSSKLSAKKHRREWDLDVVNICERVERGVCEVTGIPFKFGAESPWKPSIDRIDNTRGYVQDNVQIVVVLYNYAKHMFCLGDLMHLAKALIQQEQHVV